MVFARITTFLVLAVLGLTSCSKPAAPKPNVILAHRIYGNTGLVQITLSPDQLQSLANAKILRIAKRTPDDGPVVLSTSKFFGQLIAKQPGMENIEFAELAGTSEFDFFLDYLKANPGAIASGPAPGWSNLTPP
ncbi:MAG: hypothetical protein NTV93_00550 [Verrucomicrobia bacterium]|nr:hypothetical protein [Verrucomicrobiota bacterium]